MHSSEPFPQQRLQGRTIETGEAKACERAAGLGEVFAADGAADRSAACAGNSADASLTVRSIVVNV